MSEPFPAKDATRSKSAWWAWIPVGLGLVVLVGGTIAGAAFALRHEPPSAATTVSAAPSPVGPSPSATLTTPLPPGTSVTPAAAPPDRLPPAVKGDAFAPSEAEALLPVTAGAPIWGVVDAAATLAVFGDLDCPHTRAELRTAARLTNRFGERLRVVYYHRPLTDHALSFDAAAAIAGVVSRSGADRAFRVLTAAAESSDHPDAAAIQRWFAIAGAVDDPARLARDAADVARVKQDLALAVLLDVQATPTAFINGRRLVGEQPDEVLERMIDDEARAVRWLRAQGVSAEESYVRRVRRNLIGVDSGAPNRACVDVDGAPSEGSSRALVTVVEFSNFASEEARAFDAGLKSVLARHRGFVRHVFRNLVSDRDAQARSSAMVAMAARALAGDRAFWLVHDHLRADPHMALTEPGLAALAGAIGVDVQRLLQAVHDPERRRELAADDAVARGLAVRTVPTLFINGRQVGGSATPAGLDAVLREEIEAARRVASGGVPAERFHEVLCADGASPP